MLAMTSVITRTYASTLCIIHINIEPVYGNFHSPLGGIKKE